MTVDELLHRPLQRGDCDLGRRDGANLAIAIAIAVGITVNWDTIVDMFGSWVLVASVVIIAVALVLGALVGGRTTETRTTTGLVTGMRFGSLGLIIIGTQLGGDADYLGPAVTFALLDFVIPVALAVELGRREASVGVAAHG